MAFRSECRIMPIMTVPVPDYTSQLNEIVKALNRPSISPLLAPLIPAACGFIFALAIQWITRWSTERRQIGKLRRLVYQDLTELFFCVYRAMDQDEESILGEDRAAWRREQLSQMSFKAEKACLDQADIFMQLEEHFVCERLYIGFHRVVKELDLGVGAMNINTERVMNLLSIYVGDGNLKRVLFGKYKPEVADFLLEELDRRYKQQQSPTWPEH
jgi:hypothetical protein